MIISVWYGIALIVDQKWKNKIYKLGKVGKIPVLGLARSMSKKQKETDNMIEKYGFKAGPRLYWKIAETF